MTVLLDGSVLIALSITNHVHHERAGRWFASVRRCSTCPITQGTLLRTLVRTGLGVDTALRMLETLTGNERHEFWSDDRPYDAETVARVIGHKQVTDAYLATLARSHKGRLATLDEGFAVTHFDVVDLVPLLAADRGAANGGG